MNAIARIDPQVSPPPGSLGRREFDDTLGDVRVSRIAQAADTTRPAPEPPPDIVAAIQAKLALLAPAPATVSASVGAARAEPAARLLHDMPTNPERVQAVEQAGVRRLDDTAVTLEATQLDTATRVRHDVT